MEVLALRVRGNGGYGANGSGGHGGNGGRGSNERNRRNINPSDETCELCWLKNCNYETGMCSYRLPSFLYSGDSLNYDVAGDHNDGYWFVFSHPYYQLPYGNY